MDNQVEKKYIAADILRKRKQNVERIQHKVQTKIQRLKERKQRPENKHLTPEFLVQNYKAQQQAYSRFKKRSLKLARSDEEFQKDRLLLVLRIRGKKKKKKVVKDISEQQKKILKQFKLPEINSATFLKVDIKTLKRLKRVENYITYGYPSRKVISELIYKKCYAKIKGQREHIDNNKKVEDNLGDKGIICLEDLVNEIVDIGPNFKEVMKFIWTFKLTNKQDGWDQKKIIKPFDKGGEWGNREDKINNLVFSMI
ncbi:ribosomal protein component of cytosolic 80s ribosome and 60s large subunit, putative [Ichthyophthirius multifiliis]|uniref:Ribosomal protein component of cytosolic 80s ribosome and 60s large subunit, putative n=1 Tax=Ichthyophthirius multifiliis TaxID=5932 RepID=G0QNA7_ICHMU|nr:ribosomal protein component of cytosolic 80s ribosome and 60s large subunit, putative [Ichthyophthirius multifiliis]EGR33299.1 ribosomal protein component of cytosolic 80s ribosome and 60s large subunit, putative [Ichthyophthirius multifiliis]|eukprot:XP_004037285.1 ribosomal protein component of cytosolic 80s ribosome and 60s large subunit, putative [Ichthyophthirius multifiliis]